MQTSCNRNSHAKLNLGKAALVLSAALLVGSPGIAFSQGAPDTSQIQALTTQRDQLENRAKTGAASTAELIQLQMLQKQVEAGRPFTSDEAKAQGLVAERDVLERRIGSRQGSEADNQRLMMVR